MDLSHDHSLLPVGLSLLHLKGTESMYAGRTTTKEVESNTRDTKPFWVGMMVLVVRFVTEFRYRPRSFSTGATTTNLDSECKGRVGDGGTTCGDTTQGHTTIKGDKFVVLHPRTSTILNR